MVLEEALIDLKICCDCGKSEREEEFTSKALRCKKCIRIRNRKAASDRGVKEKFIPVVTDTHKQCITCKELKLLGEYSGSPRGRKGKSSYCKPCASMYQLSKVSKKERREKTQKYRDNNREWWRFLHRLNQYNRRTKLDNQSDGTVDREFMIKLYSIERCYYCKEFIPKSKRTCEHIQPLNKGGIHGKSNITMSCLSCNSIKRDMTEEQFKKYKINNKICQKKEQIYLLLL